MKRSEFEEKIEKAAAKLEAKLEGAAERCDKSLNKAADSPWGRRILRIINCVLIAAFLCGGFVLLNFSQTAWAIVCFAAAGLTVAGQIIDLAVFRG